MVNKIISEEANLIKEEVDLNQVDWQPLFDRICKNMGLKVAMKMKIVPGRRGEMAEIECPNLVSKAGIFKSIIKEVSPQIFNFGQTEKGLWMTVTLSYSHQDGGSNGSQMLTAWLEGDKWTFRDAGK